MTDNNAETSSAQLIRLAVEVVSAYLGQNPLPADQIPGMLREVYGSLVSLGGPAPSAIPEAAKPAVSVKKSVTPDYIICLEDGKQLKMLKRHLRVTYNMTPEEYRAKWNLPRDYPMVAPNYAVVRSEFAKQIGLGRKSSEVAPAQKVRKGRKAAL